MSTMTKDLSPGDEFEYVTQSPGYRMGKFLVLNTEGSYLRLAATQGCRFLYSYAAKKVVNHFAEQEVIKKEIPVSSKNKMGHFTGWQFGVDVIVHPKVGGSAIRGRLIQEATNDFKILTNIHGVVSYNKVGYYYELIPYKYSSVMNPRYPVCVSLSRTAFCNSLGILNMLDTTSATFKEYPTAKLILADGTVIELSGETTESLRQQFGR